MKGPELEISVLAKTIEHTPKGNPKLRVFIHIPPIYVDEDCMLQIPLGIACPSKRPVERNPVPSIVQLHPDV